MTNKVYWSLKALEILGVLVLGACSAQPPTSTPEVINIYATSAAYPWLGTAYECAPTSATVRLTAPDSADIILRLGEPTPLSTPAYQIGVDDVLVVIHPQAGISALTPDQARLLFSGEVANWTSVGGSDLPVQVWTFSPAEDIQVAFDRFVTRGRPITSWARLAVSAQAMSDSVGSVPGSIGILPRRWKAGNTREALVVSSLPVLAVVRAEPKGTLRALLGCLQAGG